jgi:5-methylcytosine-specific restriction endonuclease McrA
MRRHLYPADWDAIALATKTRAGWRCEACGLQCRRPAEPFDTHRRTLTVSHTDHNPVNCEPENLRALCSGCHLRYDAPEKARRRRLKERA